MRIALATPLYPPDIAPPAPYVKELARRLRAASHEVTVIAYSHLPEAIEGVRIIAIDKRRPLPLRLLSLIVTLVREANRADAVIVENGASTELAGGIAARLTRTAFVMHVGDQEAHTRSQRTPSGRRLESFLARRATVINVPPPARPEILPFEERPQEALDQYDAWWDAHLASLMRTIDHGA